MAAAGCWVLGAFGTLVPYGTIAPSCKAALVQEMAASFDLVSPPPKHQVHSKQRSETIGARKEVGHNTRKLHLGSQRVMSFLNVSRDKGG